MSQAADPELMSAKRPIVVLFLSLGLGAFVFGTLFAGYHHWQLVGWIASLALLMVALRDEPTATDRSASSLQWTNSEFLALALITLLGAFFRLYRLDTLPPGLWVDECNVAGSARHLMGKDFAPFGHSPLTWLQEWVQTSNLYLYFVTLVFKVFGYNYWGIKMISVIPGVLGVPALYLFCRELAGKWTALFAGILFAVGHWNVRLSRWGWDEIAMTTLQILSYAFLVRGLQRGRRRDVAWAGIFMGLCLSTYVASRLALAAALATLAIHSVSRRRTLGLRTGPLLVFTAAVALTVAPLIVFFFEHPQLFNVRTSEVNIFNKVAEAGSLTPLWRNVKMHLLMFHVRGDIYPKHALPEEPMLDPLTGFLFVLGLAGSAWKWRSSGYLLSLLWLAFGLLAGMLSDNWGAPHAFRTGNVAPVATAMAALPLGWLMWATSGKQRWKAALRPIALGTAAVLLGVAVWLNFDNYFVRWASRGDLWNDLLIARGSNAARYLLDHGAGRQTFVARRFLDQGFLCLMAGAPTAGELDPGRDPPLRVVNADPLYISEPEWRSCLESWYPHAALRELRKPDGEPYAIAAEIPASDVAATLGLHRYEIREGVVPPLGADSPALSRLPAADRSGTVFTGTMHVSDEGFATFAVPDRSVAGIWVDGERILDKEQVSSKEFAVAPGLHSIWFLVNDPRADLPQILLRRRNKRGKEIPIDNLSTTPEGSPHGLRAEFYTGVDWLGDPILTLEAARPGIVAGSPQPPYSVNWRGYLRAESAGEYIFGTLMDDGGSVSVDGKIILENPGSRYVETSIALLQGLHPIEVKFYERGGGAYLTLYWAPPQREEPPDPEHWAEEGFVPIGEDEFFRLPFAGSGLLARYYDNTEFRGEPFLSVIEPGTWLGHHEGKDFSVELEGDLYVPVSGSYWLGLNSDDGSWLYLDGELVIDNGGVHGLAPVGQRIELSAGRHHILVRYFQKDAGQALQLLWTRGDEVPTSIPPVFLYPWS